jgi:hypothetical protein
MGSKFLGNPLPLDPPRPPRPPRDIVEIFLRVTMLEKIKGTATMGVQIPDSA